MSDLLEFRGISGHPNFDHFRRNGSFSTPTLYITHWPATSPKVKVLCYSASRCQQTQNTPNCSGGFFRNQRVFVAIAGATLLVKRRKMLKRWFNNHDCEPEEDKSKNPWR